VVIGADGAGFFHPVSNAFFLRRRADGCFDRRRTGDGRGEVGRGVVRFDAVDERAMLTELIEISKDIVDAARLKREIESKRVVRREVTRITMKAVQRKQYADAVARMERAVSPMFDRQFKSAAKRLRELVIDKAVSQAAENLAKQIFDPREWDKELIDRSFLAVAKTMGEAAVSTLAAVGVRIGKGSKDARIGFKRLDDPLPAAEKASTASEWLESQGTSAPPGVSTEFPDWLKLKIGEELVETFDQDYWDKMNDTTLGDLGQILDKGLKEGKSIRTMAAEISRLGPEYSKKRGELIARTESGFALNMGHDASIEGLKEELGEAGKYIGKSWLSVLGNTTRDSHADLDGVLADEEGMWELGGIRIPVPGHYTLPPENRCNCQCMPIMELGVGAPPEEIEAIIAEQEGRLTGKEEADALQGKLILEITAIESQGGVVDVPPEWEVDTS